VGDAVGALVVGAAVAGAAVGALVIGGLAVGLSAFIITFRGMPLRCAFRVEASIRSSTAPPWSILALTFFATASASLCTAAPSSIPFCSPVLTSLATAPRDEGFAGGGEGIGGGGVDGNGGGSGVRESPLGITSSASGFGICGM